MPCKQLIDRWRQYTEELPSLGPVWIKGEVHLVQMIISLKNFEQLKDACIIFSLCFW